MPAERVLFLDDAESIVLGGARSVGLQSLHHRDATATRAALAALVPDLNPHPAGVVA